MIHPMNELERERTGFRLPGSLPVTHPTGPAEPFGTITDLGYVFHPYGSNPARPAPSSTATFSPARGGRPRHRHPRFPAG